MKEADLQKAVIEHAKLLGWRIAHFSTSRAIRDGAFYTAQRGNPGFPDLVLLRPPRMIFAELKTQRGRVDFDQATWLNGIELVPGCEQFVWRPADWPDAIDAVLR